MIKVVYQYNPILFYNIVFVQNIQQKCFVKVNVYNIKHYHQLDTTKVYRNNKHEDASFQIKIKIQ